MEGNLQSPYTAGCGVRREQEKAGRDEKLKMTTDTSAIARRKEAGKQQRSLNSNLSPSPRLIDVLWSTKTKKKRQTGLAGLKAVVRGISVQKAVVRHKKACRRDGALSAAQVHRRTSSCFNTMEKHTGKLFRFLSRQIMTIQKKMTFYACSCLRRTIHVCWIHSLILFADGVDSFFLSNPSVQLMQQPTMFLCRSSCSRSQSGTRPSHKHRSSFCFVPLFVNHL